MEDVISDENYRINSKTNSSEFIKRIDTYLEKGSMEHLFQENVKEKDFPESSDDKDIDKEKFISEISSSDKNLKFNAEDSNKFTKPYNKNFNFETLNRDLADIEERLRATRLGWNKSGKSVNESNEIDGKDFVRKSWSLLDIEKRPYSNGSSINDLDSNKPFSGEKINCESPALSDGLLKWDYGADIGLNQDDSDDMEPITWPVTAEQAQRDFQASESNGIGRRMKMSLSQGSFLSSPDPEDRHNIIAKISAEYKSNKILHSLKNKNTTASTEIISKANGIYDDLSAKQIMEQAEEAEKRLRLRLEAVKALHLNDHSRFQETDADKESPMEQPGDINDGIPSQNFPDSRMSKDAQFDEIDSNNELMNVTVKSQQNKLIEDIVSNVQKPNFLEEECISPNSFSNTGRTTTVESTHASSDYGKAPVFTGEIYGSRKDIHFIESGFVMYSKQNRETFIGKTKSLDNKEMRNPRIICGIPPELDTISSRETLQITDEKKDDLLLLAKTNNSNTVNIDEMKDSDNHLSDKDVSQENSLQAKWNQFKAMMKDEEYDNLIEKTNIRSAVQYVSPVNGKSYEHCNTNRQASTATTFTTITNISPRYDSFATEVFRNPQKESHNNQRNSISKRTGSQEDKNRSNSGIIVENKIYRASNQKYNSNQDLPSRSKPGKRLTTGSGGGGRDNEDNDDEKSQTERRKLRHTAELAKFKKRFGSGALDGETTASELEHDDLSKFKRNLMEKDKRKKQLSHMLTEISKQGVADDSVQDFSDVSESSSVDTMLLMNKMSHLLKKKAPDNNSKRDFRKCCVEKPDRRCVEHSNQKERPIKNPKRVIESDDAKLILKHLMLKQKVKWLADCAREESRRRKIHKLQKLMDLYEHGNPIIIPDDLETDTATLMGSNRNSQEDLCSHSDSYSVYESDISDAGEIGPPKAAEGNFHSNKNKKYPPKSPIPQKHRNGSKESFNLPKESSMNNQQQKSYPVSEAWHIPLREPDSQKLKDFNDSNEFCCDSPCSDEINQKYFRQSCANTYSQIPVKPVNLTARERLKLRRELELARQRNAHECQKDLRHMKTGDTKVTRGGLSWAVGSNGKDSNNSPHPKNKEENPKSWMYSDENIKDSSHQKSGLQSAFESKMENFISRSRQRQKRIKLAMEERRYESQMNLERSRLFASNNEDGRPVKRRPVTQPDPLSADRQIRVSAQRKTRNNVIKSSSVNGKKYPISEHLYKPRRRYFSKNEMRFQSAKKYQALPEVQAKYLDERKKARIQNNRMKMHLYGERILQSLLRNRGPWVAAQS